MLEQFREIARPSLHLIEQPDVLNGDHGLVGEGLATTGRDGSMNGPGSTRVTAIRPIDSSVAQQRHE